MYGVGAGLSRVQSSGRAISKPYSRNGVGGDVSRLLKRLRGPHSPRRMVLAAVTSGVALGCLAMIGRGVAWLRTPPDTRIPVAPGAGARAPAPPALSASQIGEQILARNIFDSATGALSWQLESAASETDGGASSGGAPMLGDGGRCSGDLRLLASVVRTSGGDRSLAALRKDNKTEIVTVGEKLGELELIAVYPTGAYLRDGTGRTCSLPVYLSANDAPPPPLPPPPPVVEAPAEKPARKELTESELEARKKRPPAFTEEELARNIRKLGPSRFAVTRELLARARMNPSGISRGARFKPQTRDGRAAGMQVFKLRDDSLLAHLGVQQGDVLRGINGFGLGSADGVLEAFGHLGKQKEVVLAIERDGAPSTIQYVLE